MQPHTIITLLFFSIFGATQAGKVKVFKKQTETKCQHYSASNPKDNTHWVYQGHLNEAGLDHHGSKRFTNILSTKGQKAAWSFTTDIQEPVKKGSELKIQLKKENNDKKLGQQWRVDYLDKDGKVLKQYWIMPRETCSGVADFAADAVVGVSVNARIW